MGFSLSPAVSVSEFDLTTVIPAIDTTSGGFAGHFQWGPIEKRLTITDEPNLISRVFKPDANTYLSFFTAANFLAYSNALQLVRAGSASMKNATADTTGILIKNEDAYENAYYTGAGTVGEWAARYSGSLGNSLKVSTCPSAAAFTSNLSATGALTATTVSGSNVVTLSANASGNVIVGDYVKVGTLNYARVVSISTGADNANITISGTAASSLVANVFSRKWEFADSFDGATGTSVFASNVMGSNDELHVVVVDEDGLFTGIANTILERFPFYSKASDSRAADGSALYYRDVILQRSQYAYWMDHMTTGTNFGNTASNTAFTQPALPTTYSLGGGITATPTDAELETAYDLFASAEDVDITLLMGGACDSTVANYLISTIAEGRKDTVVFLSPQQANVVNNFGNEQDACVNFRNSLPSSSYGVLDGNWKYQFDKYNNVYRWVPLNGDIAGLAARTDFDRALRIPAGYNRGGIKNVIKLAWNPKKANRDILFKNGINPVITEHGQGSLLLGDKTLYSKPSAFNEIGVRRLFIVLEKSIATAAKFSLFEFNDEFTRAQFVTTVDPFLRDVKGRRGITFGRVICDETNNTPFVINSNQFVGDIYVIPNRSIRDIQLHFIALPTGVVFEEVENRFF